MTSAAHFEVHVGHDVHAGAQPPIVILAGIEIDLHRNALHDFHVVSGSVLRRKQAEARAGGAGDAVNMAFQSLASRIYVDVRFLPNLHVPELILFEIGGDPDFIEGHDGEELLAGLNIQAHDHGLIHFSADGSNDLGIAEIELGLLQERAFFFDVSDRGPHSGFRR